MNEYMERTDGSGLVVGLIGLIALIVVAVIIGRLVMPSITSNQAEIATQRSQATQAQAAAQQAAERERSERATQEQQTLRTNADLRAEATARTQNIATMILTAGLVIVGALLCGAGLIVGLNWYEGRQAARLAQQEAAATRNTLMILQAQAQLAQPSAYMQIEPPNWGNRPRQVTVNAET